jgi:Dyp-type peroxidase family
MAVKIASSKHLRTATELTLVAPIKAKFARTPSHDTFAYATRLGALLGTLFELRRASIEQAMDGSVGPLERLRTLHHFSWSVFDGGTKLLLAVTFDRPWEPYIRAIVDRAGPFLDVIFCHCEGYEPCSTERGYRRFAEWVRRHQIDVSLFYAAEPDLTVDDQRYLRQFEQLYRTSESASSFASAVKNLTLGEPGRDGIPPAPPAPDGPDELEQHALFENQRLLRSSAALASLAQLFHVADPDDSEQVAARRFFDRAAWMVLEPIAPASAIASLPAPLHAMVDRMQGVTRAALEAGRSAAARMPAAGAAASALRDREIQANVLTSYPRMTHGCMLLIGFDSGESARAFVGRMAREVTSHAETKSARLGVNVALSFEGFRTLGLSELELEAFPIEFREGMAARAGSLGDIGPEHPDRWQGPRRSSLESAASGPLLSLSEVDLALIVQAALGKIEELEWGVEHPLYATAMDLVGADPGTRVLSVQPLQREYMSNGAEPNSEASEGIVKERFGFADGVSQPIPAPTITSPPKPSESMDDRVALGEILIGHDCDRGAHESYPSGPLEYTLDGSFLVVRQLEQDVTAFERFIDENAARLSGGAEALYTQIMGRRRDGWSPMSQCSLNEFDYLSDPRGEKCPLASHVRRANPRTPREESVHGLPLRGPRIARRGFSYGPFSSSHQPAQPRGLLFMAYNASLAEQFEVIQRWLNGANSTGVPSAHADPLVSHRAGQVITVFDEGEPRHLVKKKPFVKLIWGHYFFAPSKAALERLAGLEASRADRVAAVERQRALSGEDTIQKLLGLELLERAALARAGRPDAPLEKSIFQWKVLFEDRAARAEARAVWAAVRQLPGGVLRTAYGVLVGSADGVRRVLGDEAHFSARAYAPRMQASVGLLYLGMDRCPVTGAAAAAAGEGGEVSSACPAKSYAAAATLPNRFMYELGCGDSFARAQSAAAQHFADLGPSVDLTELAKRVVSDVARSWFGLPRDRPGYDTFHAAALTIFLPKPDPVQRAAASALSADLDEAKAEARAKAPPLARFLEQNEFTEDVGTALIGGAQGTLAATVGSFVNVANHCLQNQRLPRLAAWLKTPSGQRWKADLVAGAPLDPATPIVREVLHAMLEQPAPELLHREVVAGVRLGDVDLVPGDSVVVSLGSALASSPQPMQERELLFGGAYPSEGAAPKHPCPGAQAALGLILGLLVTLLEHDVRRDGVLRVSAPDDARGGVRTAALASQRS